MSDGLAAPEETRSAAERLLEDSWEARARRASRRELAVEGGVGALFLLVAGWLAARWGAGLDLGVAGLLLVVYALLARIEFPVGTGHVVPTHLVLVPMFVVLPPGAVPLLVMGGLVAATLAEWRLGRTPARRIVSAVADAWHALGPALVLVLLGPPTALGPALALLAVAFVACCLADLAAALVRMRLTGLVPDLRVQASVMLTVWAVDLCLAPLGVLAAVATQHGVGAVLLVVPLGLLLRWQARDRSRRIEQAHDRLKLVERERARLRSAVRRLGDAFASKLDLDGLLEILLHGSVEALDAAAGRLELEGAPRTRRLEAGSAARLHELDAVPGEGTGAGGTQTRRGESWVLAFPLTVAAGRQTARGVVRVVRDGRPFEDAELALLGELVAKAELAAGEILLHEALREQAVTDPLTGLGNRRRLGTDLARALARAATDAPALLLLFDLDGFKGYNDTFGHLAGDALLTRLGAKLREVVAPHGAAYRLGGDEFCALLELGDADLDALMTRTASALGEAGEQFAISASLGAVLVPHEADSPDHALQLADERMYAHKRSRPTGPRDQARDVLLRTMQAKQPALDAHASEVARLAVRVARHLGMGGEELDEVARAAELHDVGKVGIPDAILDKPEALTLADWEFMHQHTILGERILNAAPALRPVARLVRSSHERWDGAGYPDGLAGEAIPLGARIVAVCDAYEAMTADRPYRDALRPEEARAELRAGAGGQFDPRVVEAFLAVLDLAPEGAERDVRREAIGDAAAHIRAVLSGAAGATRSGAGT